MAARQSNRIKPLQISKAKPGKYADGGGLYLIVAPTGSRKWVLRFTWHGKAREMGLGAATDKNLKAARSAALEAQGLIARGIDPIAARAQDDGIPEFGAFADQVRESLSAGFRNEKHKAQWKSSLDSYAAPIKGKRVDLIDTADVLKCLTPIWTAKPETASRVRGRIEKILDAAKAKGYRTAENPARWRGHLDHLLPKQSKLARGHHAALPYQDVPTFMEQLRQREAVAALALEFTILTCARTKETLEAEWSEFDLDGKVWTVPASHMKTGRVHRVPLSARALEIIEKLQKGKTGKYVFPGQKPDRPLSSMAMEMVLRRMNVTNATVHGFRSSFRDWAGNETTFPRELAEQSLAHVIGDKAEQAYRRGDALERRRALMDAWTDFSEKNSITNVLPMSAGKRPSNWIR